MTPAKSTVCSDHVLKRCVETRERLRCKDPENPQRHGPYHQLSWVHRGKSTTQFIRRPFVSQVKTELASYKTFRRLTDQWVELALDAAKLKLQAAKAA